ncbi:c-type cytochrome, partial [Acidobacteria bacterium AH-259-G07]|nr:c-type cytochrome [Acidobacteria bacterium AH-259-G07]
QDGKQLWVALSGTHELAVIDLPGVLKRVREFNRARKMEKTKADSSVYVEQTYTDLRFLEGLSRRVKLGGNGPRAMAISAGRLFAGMYFSETLESIDLQNPEAGSQSIALSSEKPMTAIRRGELLFHDASIAFQNWQSCSTCHQDGRSDGLNWDLTNDGVGNTKNTKSLLFAGKTPPMTMTGMLASLEKCVRFELKTILFTTLPDEDAQAIVSYLKSLRPVASPHLENGKQTASTLRGKEIFRKAKCANCHKGEYFTSMEKKNLGTHVLGDQHRSFDVPTLREVWRTAPYLHHGRAATIREVIREFNPQDRHGEVSKLSDQEIIDLVNYVLSL